MASVLMMYIADLRPALTGQVQPPRRLCAQKKMSGFVLSV